MEIQENEINKKLEALKNEYEKRQIDLRVLNEMVMEKTFKLDEIRTELGKVTKEVEEKKTIFIKLMDDFEAVKKKVESAQGENKGIKLSIEKNKAELEHANRLIELKEDEIKLLNEQLEKKEARKKEIDEQVKISSDLKNEFETKKDSYNTILKELASDISRKHEFLISIESLLTDQKKMIENLIEKRVEIKNFFSTNDNILASLKNYIDSLTADYRTHEIQIQTTKEKTKILEAQYEKILKLKEDFDKIIIFTQTFSQKLKNGLEPPKSGEEEVNSSPKKTKQKSS